MKPRRDDGDDYRLTGEERSLAIAAMKPRRDDGDDDGARALKTYVLLAAMKPRRDDGDDSATLSPTPGRPSCRNEAPP